MYFPVILISQIPPGVEDAPGVAVTSVKLKRTKDKAIILPFPTYLWFEVKRFSLSPSS